jgi:predicted nucleic-acid-binding Zn-ribbon protein
MSEVKKCPKCGGEMENGDIVGAVRSVWFRSSEKTQWSGLASKTTSTKAYSCKVCGYVEIYRNSEKET